jgi:hypothetical protein
MANSFFKKFKEFGGVYAFMGLGALYTLHGLSHIIQAGQSLILASSSLTEGSASEGVLGKIIEITLHNPTFGILWAALGIGSIFLAYHDRKHHKKLHAELDHYKSIVKKHNLE